MNHRLKWVTKGRHLLTSFLLPALLLIAGTLLFQGCTDQFTGSDSTATPILQDGEKFRHSHLMDRATTTTVQVAGKKPGSDPAPPAPTPDPDPGTSEPTPSEPTNESLTGLIFSLDTQAVLDRYGILDRYKVLERYKVLDRYKVLERYEYDYVFDGYAIWASDTYLGELIAAMEADPDIAWVEPDVWLGRMLQPQGSESGAGEMLPWGVDRIGALGHRADGVELYLIDTGISHDDINVVEALDFRDPTLVSTLDAADYDGHGTHLAALAGAIDDNDGIIGVAPGVNIHSLKVLNGDESTAGEEVQLASAIAAVEYVTGQKLQNPNTPMVVNFSLGANVGTSDYNALDTAISAAIANGVTVVVSAGNYGVDVSTITPAHVDGALTVGAYDVYNDFASYSNHGSGVDILAPGTDLPSLASSTLGLGADDYIMMSGTSQAAALVSGAAAVFLAENPQASPQQVREALVNTGVAQINGTSGGTTNLSVSLADVQAIEVPPFFRYAITSQEDFTLPTGGSTVMLGIEPGGNPYLNANVFTNGDFDIRNTSHTMNGFAYYVGRMKAQNRKVDGVIAPNYNPTWLDVHQQVAPVEIPVFDSYAFQHLATKTTSGNLNLSGHYDLGTRENPTIWFVEGDLGSNGDVTLSGYGVFLVTGMIKFNSDVVTLDDPGETTLGLYANDDIKLNSAGLSISGQLFTNADVAFSNGSSIYGNITVGGKVSFGNSSDNIIYYRPASPALTAPFWSMGVAGRVEQAPMQNMQGQQSGKAPTSIRKLITRY